MADDSAGTGRRLLALDQIDAPGIPLAAGAEEAPAFRDRTPTTELMPAVIGDKYGVPGRPRSLAR